LIKNLFVYNQKGISINKKSIHKLIHYLKQELNFVINNLEINFVNPETILEINKNYLNHNYYTDVIAFNYSEENNNLDGEIFICNEIAKENSKIYRVNYEDELKRLVIHGILHLIGYNDKIPAERKKMKLKEDSLVKKTKKLGDILK